MRRLRPGSRGEDRRPGRRVKPLRHAGAMAVLILLAGACPSARGIPLNAPANGAPTVGHVWLIMLENHSFAENFGSAALAFKPRPGSPESMDYMARTLPSL